MKVIQLSSFSVILMLIATGRKLWGELGNLWLSYAWAGEKYFPVQLRMRKPVKSLSRWIFWKRIRRTGAVIYADGKDADWVTNPTAYEIIEKQVTATDILSVNMAKGGGQAITFMPL